MTFEPSWKLSREILMSVSPDWWSWKETIRLSWTFLLIDVLKWNNIFWRISREDYFFLDLSLSIFLIIIVSIYFVFGHFEEGIDYMIIVMCWWNVSRAVRCNICSTIFFFFLKIIFFRLFKHFWQCGDRKCMERERVSFW